MKPRILKNRSASRGYTLVEILIAMVILVIAFLAIVASGVSTSQGYISARDGIQASEIGRRVIDLIHVEGDHWDERPNQPFAPSTTPWASSPFDNTPRPLFAMVGAPWSWQVLFSEPVTTNLANQANRGINTRGTYCVYARGARLAGANAPRAIQVQVAVVYSGPNNFLRNCIADVALTDLDLGSDPVPGETLTLSGLRVRYFGTVVTPK